VDKIGVRMDNHGVKGLRQ